MCLFDPINYPEGALPDFSLIHDQGLGPMLEAKFSRPPSDLWLGSSTDFFLWLVFFKVSFSFLEDSLVKLKWERSGLIQASSVQWNLHCLHFASSDLHFLSVYVEMRVKQVCLILSTSLFIAIIHRHVAIIKVNKDLLEKLFEVISTNDWNLSQLAITFAND